jgi:hypothetical protein
MFIAALFTYLAMQTTQMSYKWWTDDEWIKKMCVFVCVCVCVCVNI